MSSTHQTLIILKPNGVKQSLQTTLMQACLDAGLQIIDMDVYNVEGEDANYPAEELYDLVYEHYSEHEGESYFQILMDYMSKGPLFVLRCKCNDESKNAIDIGRTILHDFRKKYPTEVFTTNVIHASGCQADVDRELKIWFPSILDYDDDDSSENSFGSEEQEEEKRSDKSFQDK